MLHLSGKCSIVPLHPRSSRSTDLRRRRQPVRSCRGLAVAAILGLSVVVAANATPPPRNESPAITTDGTTSATTSSITVTVSSANVGAEIRKSAGSARILRASPLFASATNFAGDFTFTSGLGRDSPAALPQTIRTPRLETGFYAKNDFAGSVASSEYLTRNTIAHAVPPSSVFRCTTTEDEATYFDTGDGVRDQTSADNGKRAKIPRERRLTYGTGGDLSPSRIQV